MDNEQGNKNNQGGDDNLGSFYMGRMRQPPEPKRLLPPGVLTFITLAALGGIVWYAYPRGAEKYTDIDVPVVKADTSPIKEEPVEPGGMEVPHQDSTAFNPIVKEGGAEVENLLPAPEQPMEKDEAIKSAIPSAEPPQLDLATKEALGQSLASEPSPATPAPALASAPEVLTPPAAEAPKAPEPEAAAPAPAKAPEPKATPVAKGDYEVQLGSFRTQEDAKREWSKLGKKYASLLGPLKMRLVKADIPGKGIYYRLRAGKVSKEKAQGICDALKADKRGCILAKN